MSKPVAEDLSYISGRVGQMSAYIWVATSRAIEHSREVGWDSLQERGNDSGLIRRLCEQVREPTTGEVQSALGVDTNCGTNSSDERARGREDGDEGVVRALVGFVVSTTNTTVA